MENEIPQSPSPPEQLDKPNVRVPSSLAEIALGALNTEKDEALDDVKQAAGSDDALDRFNERVGRDDALREKLQVALDKSGDYPVGVPLTREEVERVKDVGLDPRRFGDFYIRAQRAAAMRDAANPGWLEKWSAKIVAAFKRRRNPQA